MKFGTVEYVREGDFAFVNESFWRDIVSLFCWLKKNMNLYLYFDYILLLLTRGPIFLATLFLFAARQEKLGLVLFSVKLKLS